MLLVAGSQTVREGEDISIDGTSGKVFAGRMETETPSLNELAEAAELLSWADQTRTLGVWANADTPADATQAIALGAEGIGLMPHRAHVPQPATPPGSAEDAAECRSRRGVAPHPSGVQGFPPRGAGTAQRR